MRNINKFSLSDLVDRDAFIPDPSLLDDPVANRCPTSKHPKIDETGDKASASPDNYGGIRKLGPLHMLHRRQPRPDNGDDEQCRH